MYENEEDVAVGRSRIYACKGCTKTEIERIVKEEYEWMG